jgi:uncharacterized protein (DUF1778 family)
VEKQAAKPDGPETAVKSEHVVARVSVKQKRLFERAAALRNQPLSQFMINTLQREAEATLRAYDVVTLSLRDSEHFAALVLDPPAPTAALRSALERHAEVVQSTGR